LFVGFFEIQVRKCSFGVGGSPAELLGEFDSLFFGHCVLGARGLLTAYLSVKG
jgi:hypothetical protein